MISLYSLTVEVCSLVVVGASQAMCENYQIFASASVSVVWGQGGVGGASLHIQFPKDNMFNLLWVVSVGCKVLRGLGVNEVWHLVKMSFCA